jgi:electron transfer flavoprotein alpha subunit
MSTVRCDKVVEELIVSGGRGVSDHIDDFNALVTALGGTQAASRALVDMNRAPYSHQIGLTGKNASAKVYVAVGISGAVQHTCALDSVGTVIAINPDKNARIFEYADYGIVARIEDIISNI